LHLMLIASLQKIINKREMSIKEWTINRIM